MRDSLMVERLWIPLGQGVVTGALGGIAIAAGAVVWSWPHPAALGGMGLALITLASWLIFRAEAMPHEQVEIKPAAVYAMDVPRIQLNVTWNDGRAGIFQELGVSQEQFTAWCVGVAKGQSLGENHWCGLDGVFSKSQYHKMRDVLEERGFIRLRGRYYSSGYILSGKGRAVVSEMARRYGEIGTSSPNQQLRLTN